MPLTRKVLHSTRRFAIIHEHRADIAQKVEHILGKDEVTSSTLVISSTSVTLDPNSQTAYAVCEFFVSENRRSYRKALPPA